MSKTLDILLVEDNLEDIELIQAILREEKLRLRVFTVCTVEETKRFFARRHPFEMMPRPDLILLDYVLPNGTGQQIITWLKRDLELAKIPITVISASLPPGLEQEALARGATLVLPKPLRLEHVIKIVQCVPHFWFSVEVNGAG
jgi:CheY-like chemotaxis protein